VISTRRIRARAPLVLLALWLGAAHAQPATARPGQLVTFEAPAELTDDATRDATLDEISGLGARAVRLTLAWADAAPAPNARARPRFDATDPRHYDWDAIDAEVEAARLHGLRVVLTVSSPVPRWATAGRRDHVSAPDPVAFGRFMTAVGRHLGGQIAVWLIWNEPNHPRYLRPQKVDARPRSPLLYRALYLAARAGLHRAGRGKDVIVAGEIAPSARSGVAPLPFLRGMLCLNRRYRPTARRCGRLATSGLGVHPYTLIGNPLAPTRDPGQIGIATLPRLTRALDRAARAGAVPPRLPLYITEYGVQTFPDHLLGVAPLAAAAARSAAELIAYRNPRVALFSQYLMRDDLDVGGFQTGLRFADGRPKPGYEAFRVPLVAERRGARVRLWGLIRPATVATTVRVERSDDGRAWRLQGRVRTDVHGAWRLSVANIAGRRWRVVWTGPTGDSVTGPPTHAIDVP
jgi:hypothetical protein